MHIRIKWGDRYDSHGSMLHKLGILFGLGQITAARVKGIAFGLRTTF
jgi:hypothetical protein